MSNPADTNPPAPMPLATSNDGCLLALSVPFRERWIEVLAATDGQAWTTWAEDRRQFPTGIDLVRDPNGRILVVVQVVETAGDAITFELPSSPERLPLLTLEAVVTRDGHIQTSFSKPAPGLRRVPICDSDTTHEATTPPVTD